MLDKILASFAYPLGFALMGLLIAVVAMLFGMRRSGLIASVFLIAGLWAASTPVVARWMVGTLEVQYPALPVESYRPADVVVLLGGALSPPGKGDPYPDLGEAADRALHAYRLFRAGLVPKILISGGNVFADGRMPEGQALADLLVGWGIDRSAILIEGDSRSTYENARQSFAIWQREGFRSGLLVTSAMHMQRALAVFRKTGLAVEPASTDERAAGAMPPFPLSMLPDAGSLDLTSLAIKEWIGLLVYRWRGWA